MKKVEHILFGIKRAPIPYLSTDDHHTHFKLKEFCKTAVAEHLLPFFQYVEIRKRSTDFIIFAVTD